MARGTLPWKLDGGGGWVPLSSPLFATRVDISIVSPSAPLGRCVDSISRWTVTLSFSTLISSSLPTYCRLTHMMTSLLRYLIRFFVDEDGIACDATDKNRLTNNSSIASIHCQIVFVLIYYFGMASSIW